MVLDSDKPHLIGLDEDILSTGITLYQLKEGDTIIGNEEAEQKPHILLKGPRLAQFFTYIIFRYIYNIYIYWSFVLVWCLISYKDVN